MNVKKINNKLITDFLSQIEVKPLKNALLVDIFKTLNPANNLYKSETKASKFNQKNHKIFIKITYKFKHHYSANLFELIFKHLVLKNQFLLSIDRDKNRILITLKDGILIHHNEKFSKEESTIKKMEDSFAYKEDSQLISEIFLNTLETIFFSSLYQEDNKHITGSNQKILKLISTSIEDRVENNSGKTLFHNILNYINKDNPINIIITEKSIFERLVDKMKELLFHEDDEDELFIEKRIENRYL
jgi:hypothetical protein